ncbi:hypothetical protein [Bradyrhizobium japonicum]|uniref:hypothetical protein n=1 Tax=Bradyrhizobium japonicum TaxID=375 RepID=UPI0012FE141D|nr:hypothetical protein [Bradyrhizobium japonicum]
MNQFVAAAPSVSDLISDHFWRYHLGTGMSFPESPQDLLCQLIERIGCFPCRDPPHARFDAASHCTPVTLFEAELTMAYPALWPWQSRPVKAKLKAAVKAPSDMLPAIQS